MVAKPIWASSTDHTNRPDARPQPHQIRILLSRPLRQRGRPRTHKKLRYRGLAKNTAQLRTLFALANLVIVKKALLA